MFYLFLSFFSEHSNINPKTNPPWPISNPPSWHSKSVEPPLNTHQLRNPSLIYLLPLKHLTHATSSLSNLSNYQTVCHLIFPKPSKHVSNPQTPSQILIPPNPNVCSFILSVYHPTYTSGPTSKLLPLCAPYYNVGRGIIKRELSSWHIPNNRRRTKINTYLEQIELL